MQSISFHSKDSLAKTNWSNWSWEYKECFLEEGNWIWKRIKKPFPEKIGKTDHFQPERELREFLALFVCFSSRCTVRFESPIQKEYFHWNMISEKWHFRPLELYGFINMESARIHWFHCSYQTMRYNLVDHDHRSSQYFPEIFWEILQSTMVTVAHSVHLCASQAFLPENRKWLETTGNPPRSSPSPLLILSFSS